jgi:hypothetical protein
MNKIRKVEPTHKSVDTVKKSKIDFAEVLKKQMDKK